MFDHWDQKSSVYQLRGHSESLSADESIHAGRIRNFVRTPVGTLASVVDPAEYHPSSGFTVEPTYSNMNGIYHGMAMSGQRDILLIHATIDRGAGEITGIWSHQGWDRDWELIAGPTLGAQSPLYDVDLDVRERPTFLTQFIPTPSGVVILAEEAAPMFYDGEVIGRLGYDRPPGAPTVQSPKMGKVKADGFYHYASGSTKLLYDTQVGYVHNGRNMATALGYCRMGTVDNTGLVLNTGDEANPLGGTLRPGSWNLAVQFIDQWGNLSPVGLQSAPLVCLTENNLILERKNQGTESSERLRVQFSVNGIPTGPQGTVGRNLLLSHDQMNTSIPGMFEVPNYAEQGPMGFATIPDNMTEAYPLNVPDSWLLLKATEVRRTPAARVGCVAFGRLWLFNTDEAPGQLLGSYPGQWGQMDPAQEYHPDPTGGEGTGAIAVQGGMILTTANSTWLVTPGPESKVFNFASIHSTIGCVSPDTMEILPDGSVVWLSRHGFVRWDGSNLERIGQVEIEETIERINWTWAARACATVDQRSGEYRCWVPVDSGKTNTLCIVFDQGDWRERTDVIARAACSTKDERRYVLVAGDVKVARAVEPNIGFTYNRVGIWVQDHEAYHPDYTYQEREALIETHWLRQRRADRKGTTNRMHVLAREIGESGVQAEVFRDWRTSKTVASMDTAVYTYPEDDRPLVYDGFSDGSAPNLGAGEYNKLTKSTDDYVFGYRRMYWAAVDLYVPSCETFRVRFSTTGRFEFGAISYLDRDDHDGGVKMQTRG